MTAPYHHAVKHPYRTLVVAALLFAAAAPGVMRLRLRTDGHALVPAKAPQVILDREIRKQFGLTDTLAVVVRSDDSDGVFNPRTLKLIHDLTDRLAAIDGLSPSCLFSLATEKGHRVRQGSLEFLRFLDPLPTHQADATRVRDDVRLIRIFHGTAVSADEKSAAILVNVPDDVPRDRLHRDVVRVLRQVDARPDRLALTGAPIAESLLGLHILEDLGIPLSWFDADAATVESPPDAELPWSWETVRLWVGRYVGALPVAIFVMALVFLIAFGSLAITAITLIKIGGCLFVVFGIMGWTGTPVYLTIAVMPIILTATGLSDEVHIFHRYAALLARRPDAPHPDNLLLAMHDMWRPIVLTSITTAVAFLSFAVSPLLPVRTFGLFTALGCLISMTWALTVTPALAELTDPRRFRPRRLSINGPRAPVADPPWRASVPQRASITEPGSPQSGFLALISSAASSTVFTRLAPFILRHRLMILLLTAAALASSWFGIRRIRVQDSWIDGFSSASAFRRDTTDFNNQFLGMHMLYVVVDCGGWVQRGQILASTVDHFTVRLPKSALTRTDDLVGCRLELTPMDSPPPAEDRPAHLQRWYRGYVEKVDPAGDDWLLTLDRKFGSIRFTLKSEDATPLNFLLTTEPLMKPEVIQHLKALESFLAQRKDEMVGGVLGPATYVETTNFIGQGCREEYRSIPERDRLHYVWKWYESIRGADRLRATVDENFSRGIITVFMNNANFIDTARLLDLLATYEREHLAPHGILLALAGDVAVSQTLIDAIVRTQIQSLLISLLAVTLICLVLCRSAWLAILCVLPCLLAVPINFAIMGALNIPLGVATSMFASMTIGLGVDYAIHFVERLRHARAGSGEPLLSPANLIDATRTAAPANLIDALGVGLGFGVLTLSQVPANARLGFMVIISILTCLALTHLLLPALSHRAVNSRESSPL